MTLPDTPVDVQDFRKTKCPLNFVKTRLALEKIDVGSVLEVWIDATSESVMNIPKSIRAEGHEVIAEMPHEEDGSAVRLWVRRLK